MAELDGKTAGRADGLRFRDDAFHDHFGTPRDLDMVTQRFGWETRAHVQERARQRLARRLLETPQAAE